jgi:hypothetical protein
MMAYDDMNLVVGTAVDAPDVDMRNGDHDAKPDAFIASDYLIVNSASARTPIAMQLI